MKDLQRPKGAKDQEDPIDAVGMHLYELENQNEALLHRIADLEHTLLKAKFLLYELPFKTVEAEITNIEEVLDREISSYRA